MHKMLNVNIVNFNSIYMYHTMHMHISLNMIPHRQLILYMGNASREDIL